jgi:hypothetical protein
MARKAAGITMLGMHHDIVHWYESLDNEIDLDITRNNAESQFIITINEPMTPEARKVVAEEIIKSCAYAQYEQNILNDGAIIKVATWMDDPNFPGGKQEVEFVIC